ncbi:MAG: MoaD/ThiS family protein [Candidatus Nezhaarchaeota archaeon]|nr:MoaD/ThiS family protein [Candidatus Nezhaarchaeota archaeon]
MRVTVVLGGAYREVVGRKELVEELPEGSSAKDLVSKLASRYGGPFKAVVDPNEEEWVSRDVIVLVNSAVVRKLNHELRDKDKVLIADLIEVSLAGG